MNRIKKSISVLLAGVMAAGCITCVPFNSAAANTDAAEKNAVTSAYAGDAAENELIVTFSDAVSDKKIQKAADAADAEVESITDLGDVKIAQVSTEAGEMAQTAEVLAQRREVQSVQPNYQYKPAALDPLMTEGSDANYQYQFEATNALAAWDTLESGTHAKTRVAVIDSGADMLHEDLQQTLVKKSGKYTRFEYGAQKTADDDVDEELYEDEFDEEKLIWYPSVRGKGSAAIRLVLKCSEEGLKALYGYNENFGVTSNFYVEVHDKDFESPKNMFDETTNVWGTELGDDEEYQLINQDIVIDVENVSMEFKKAQEKVDNLKEYCIKWVKRELKPKNKFKALDNVSFSVHKGERVGIIGFNGAGKSTILKILSGVLKPTSGKIQTYGTIAPLLELGAGFDHNYSGRENVFLNGAILGYSREFLESKYDEILEFSELGDFIDIPIKNYSSGMVAKLGFSVATIVEPDVLILDEVLSVGDVKFQKKSGDKLKSMMGSGVTVLLVSHATDNIRELCTRAIWLDQGKLVMDGDVDYVCDAYIEAAKKASEEQLSGLDLQ